MICVGLVQFNSTHFPIDIFVCAAGLNWRYTKTLTYAIDWFIIKIVLTKKNPNNQFILAFQHYIQFRWLYNRGARRLQRTFQSLYLQRQNRHLKAKKKKSYFTFTNHLKYIQTIHGSTNKPSKISCLEVPKHYSSILWKHWCFRCFELYYIYITYTIILYIIIIVMKVTHYTRDKYFCEYLRNLPCFTRKLCVYYLKTVY